MQKSQVLHSVVKEIILASYPDTAVYNEAVLFQ